MDAGITALVEQAIDTLGDPDLPAAEIESRMFALTDGDATLARRLIDVVPEGFGLVLVSHVEPAATLQLPTEFSVQNAAGEWVDFPLTREPVFTAALLAAQRMFHAGPRLKFQTVTDRSGLLQAVNNALNDGQSLESATLGGPRFEGIPAATYAAPADGT